MRARWIGHHVQLEAKVRNSWTCRKAAFALPILLTIGVFAICSPAGAAGEPKRQYWATSLAGTVDDNILKGLYEAVAQGAVGWLDVDPEHPIPPLSPGINLIFYHVGGNCYTDKDCDRFPASRPTGDRWGQTERVIDLEDPDVRKVVVEDLVAMVKKGDQIAPYGATVGIHLDNVHRLTAEGIAEVFNDFLAAIEAAKRRGTITRSRRVGYVAKNHPEIFKQALDQRLLNALPLYQINENATLSQDEMLDRDSQLAQRIGRQYCIPVFLKTFGTDIAYTIEQDGDKTNVYVSEDMTRRMARLPDISGAAWSVDEAKYHPTIFVEGSPVLLEQRPVGPCRDD
jgi:hypothetical protein